MRIQYKFATLLRDVYHLSGPISISMHGKDIFHATHGRTRRRNVGHPLEFICSVISNQLLPLKKNIGAAIFNLLFFMYA
jgi:hypothetical protein